MPSQLAGREDDRREVQIEARSSYACSAFLHRWPSGARHVA